MLEIASSAIDVSDGLNADLCHIAQQSCVDIEVKLADVPLSRAVKACTEKNKALLENVLSGGDDYELVFSAPCDQRDVIGALSKALDIRITRIGRAREPRENNRPKVEFIDKTGCCVTLKNFGYSHF